MSSSFPSPPSPKVAVLFFGLTRSLRSIRDNIQQNLLDPLLEQGMTYDLFMHTFALNQSYDNPWSNEHVTRYDNTAYQSLNPKYVVIENQDRVESQLRIPRYFTQLGDWAGCATTPEMKQLLVRNMVLALHSKRQVTQLFAAHQHEYDYVIITRPDQQYLSRFHPQHCFRQLVSSQHVVIPAEHGYHGLNDRFCVALARSDTILQYGRAFDYLLAYSQHKSIVSEVFLKEYFVQLLHKQVVFCPLKTNLVRCIGEVPLSSRTL